MLSPKLKTHFEQLLSEKINAVIPLSGGDINQVYVLHTAGQKFVVKINKSSAFPTLFEAEAKGLGHLYQTNTFRIPDDVRWGKVNETIFLMLEFIDSGTPIKGFWSVFGKQLAKLHQTTRPYFGFEEDNYIGTLKQYNTKKSIASEFYITQRLEPQFELAFQKGFSFSNLEQFYKNVSAEIPNEPSSLIHGDLWSGNFMVDNNGMPCLIDPSVSYASREMDIAMMYLFGGFDQKLFETYNETFPMTPNWRDRLSLWQLYYLLVHLNLFGSSYYPRVKSIVNGYI